MNTKNLVEITALKELKAKFDIADIDIEFNKLHELLFSMYHIGYQIIADNIKEEYKQAFNTFNEEQWKFFIEDMAALLSQLTSSNYKILLNDIKN